ncbi:hypothetical protein PspLS_00958 [Pyricularia sp. CBS 133598]|nr:hypothetical protein PspLS_00958 [Pyricularia sp. CBS 133598]
MGALQLKARKKLRTCYSTATDLISTEGRQMG